MSSFAYIIQQKLKIKRISSIRTHINLREISGHKRTLHGILELTNMFSFPSL